MRDPVFFLADDDDFDRRSIARSFEKAGAIHQLKMFTDGAKLLTGLEQAAHLPQGILLDMNMPILDGFGVMKQLQQNDSWRNIPVFVLTSSPVHQDILWERGCRPAAFTSKPVLYDTALSLLSKYPQNPAPADTLPEGDRT